MFFLLYVPTIRRLMSRQQMELLAAQLAEQVLTQTVQEQERTPETREAVQSQLLDMMVAMQEQFSPGESAEDENPDVTPAENQPAEPAETPELMDMRNYLERCFKLSA